MATSDLTVLPTRPQDPMQSLHFQMRILLILMREGFGIKDEDSGFYQQTLPTGTVPITYAP